MKIEQKIEKDLHLVLMHHWFVMIEKGIKNEEYREKTPYWCKRFSASNCIPSHQAIQENCGNIADSCNAVQAFPFTHVVFHDGYTSTTIRKEVVSCTCGIGNKLWGAPEHEVFIIKFKNVE